MEIKLNKSTHIVLHFVCLNWGPNLQGLNLFEWQKKVIMLQYHYGEIFKLLWTPATRFETVSVNYIGDYFGKESKLQVSSYNVTMPPPILVILDLM